MRILFFALLGLNAAALLLQLTVWRVDAAVTGVASGRETGEPLVLLSELGGREVAAAKVRESGVDRSSAQSSGGARGENLCVMVGPFSALLRAEYFAENLQALEVVAEVREIDAPDGQGFWVYLPPEPNKKLALQRLKEIQANGIDSYLIPKGELANGISFGMFTRQALADVQQEKMRANGYEVEVKIVARTRKEVWVWLSRMEAQKIDAEAWQGLLGREKGIEKLQNYCQGVASA